MAIMAITCYFVHYKNRNLLCPFCYLSSTMAIIVSRDNYVHYAHYEKIMQIMFLSSYYNTYGFPMLLYALLFFPTHDVYYGDTSNCYNAYNQYNTYNFCIPPLAHSH